MFTLTSICLLFIAAKMILKLVFWLFTKDRSFGMFLLSFSRLHSVYDMQDDPDTPTRIFWKVSNFCNIIMWSAILILTTKYFFEVTSIEQ
jgi:hypothetical protein